MTRRFAFARRQISKAASPLLTNFPITSNGRDIQHQTLISSAAPGADIKVNSYSSGSAKVDIKLDQKFPK